MADISNFITEFFTNLTEIAQNFVSFLTDLFLSVFSLFWVNGSGDTAGHMTILGYFLLISIATGFVIWGFNFIRSLIRVRRNG